MRKYLEAESDNYVISKYFKILTKIKHNHHIINEQHFIILINVFKYN